MQNSTRILILAAIMFALIFPAWRKEAQPADAEAHAALEQKIPAPEKFVFVEFFAGI